VLLIGQPVRAMSFDIGVGMTDKRDFTANEPQLAQAPAHAVAFDEGRASAMAGIKERYNPYSEVTEPAKHGSWLSGHRSYNATR
jgi:hypothetical protein